jgi:hypothetical protein
VNERSKDKRARLAEVERELAQLKKQRKTLEKEMPRDLPEDWAEPRRTPAAPEPVAPPPGPEVPPGVRHEAGDWGAPPVDERRVRFASYIMAGSLGHSGEHLRKERRAMRNKAIVAAATALILLYALVHYLVN